MTIWKCPECGCTKIKTYHWQAVHGEYELDAPEEMDGWDFRYNTPGHEPDILMSACCKHCARELTDDELALIAKSIGGLVLSGHPRLPINPNDIKGYVVVNPEHFEGTPVVLGDNPWVWPDYEGQARHGRQRFVLASPSDGTFCRSGTAGRNRMTVHETPQVFRHPLGRLVSPVGIFLHRLQTDRFQISGDLGID